MKEFDPETLATFNGEEPDRPVYVAHAGKVYDVSASKLWKNGSHMRQHRAGTDLSEDFAAAPHGREVFERVKQVGLLKGAVAPKGRRPAPPWLEVMLTRIPFLIRHPHPMLVHYPIVFMFSIVGFTLLALATGNMNFATTALHCLVAALLFTPLAIITGLFTWWLNYQSRPMRPVKIKIWCSSGLMAVAAVALVWQLLVPDLLLTPGPERLGYLLLVCALAPLVSVVGWFGAMLTFPLEKK
jgi:predicted heme/steroid binding protein/uncharacterized membrane protein